MQAAMILPTTRRRATGAILAGAVLAVAVIGWPRGARAELSLGLTGGMVFGAEQAVTITTYAPGGTVESVVSRDRVPVNPSGIGGLTLTYWLDPASAWGVQAEGLYWASSLSTRSATRHFKVDETRAALLVTILGRFLLEGPGSAYFYGGLGGGLVYSRVSPGGDDFGPGVQALAGFAMMATPNIRLRFEVRYLVAPDVEPGKRSAFVAQTSGSGSANPARRIFGSRLDTQFVPVTIGVDWVF